MIWKTKSDCPYTRVVVLYGRYVSTASDEYKSACEARHLLAMPLEQRRKTVDACVRARGRGDATTEREIRAGMQAALQREWDWRKNQQAGAAA